MSAVSYLCMPRLPWPASLLAGLCFMLAQLLPLVTRAEPQLPSGFDATELLQLDIISQVRASSDDTVQVDRWLDKMSQAAQLQNFRGTLIIRQQDKLQAIRVNQGVTNDGSWQTLESLNGEQQKIFRQNDRVTSIFPSKKLITISGDAGRAPLHPILPGNRRILKKHYQLSLVGQERIANKMAQVIRMSPVDKHRYGYVFWLDQESGILLKCDMLDENGEVLEQLMYSEVELLNGEPEKPLDLAQLEGYRTYNFHKADTPVAPRWQASQLPQGFVLKRAVNTRSADQQLTHHLVYSDGMASVSVFVEHRKPEKPVLGASSMGPVNAFSSFVKDSYITAIGEVPLSTVRMIAQSMEVQ